MDQENSSGGREYAMHPQATGLAPDTYVLAPSSQHNKV